MIKKSRPKMALKQEEKSMQKLNFYRLILIAITALSLTALGCNHKPENSLQRPAEQTEQNQNQEQAASAEDNDGEVAGDITPLPTKKILVGDQEINVELANDDESRTQGLSGRDKLDEGNGMLFDFTNSDFKKPGFWMKDMLISIDMIWINKGKIIGIVNDVPLPPEDDDIPTYYPPSDVTHVLEVPAGWSAKHNIAVGTDVAL